MSSTKWTSSSSHQNITRSRPDIAKTLFTWHVTAITRSQAIQDNHIFTSSYTRKQLIQA